MDRHSTVFTPFRRRRQLDTIAPEATVRKMKKDNRIVAQKKGNITSPTQTENDRISFLGRKQQKIAEALKYAKQKEKIQSVTESPEEVRKTKSNAEQAEEEQKVATLTPEKEQTKSAVAVGDGVDEGAWSIPLEQLDAVTKTMESNLRFYVPLFWRVPRWISFCRLVFTADRYIDTRTDCNSLFSTVHRHFRAHSKNWNQCTSRLVSRHCTWLCVPQKLL